MTRRSLILTVVVLVSPLTVVTASRADCASPELSVQPAQVSRGDEVEVAGEFWNDVCDDTSQSIGCWSAPEQEDQPTQNIELFLLNRDTRARFPLGIVDANDNMGFTSTYTVDVPPGWYVLKDGGGDAYPSIGSKFRVVEPGSDGAGS